MAVTTETHTSTKPNLFPVLHPRGLWVIQNTSGPIPNELKSKYQTEVLAQRAIEDYVLDKNNKRPYHKSRKPKVKDASA